MIRYLLLLDSYGLVSFGLPYWREVGSIFYICCWPLPAQSFSGLSSLELSTIFYCLRFETSLFVASYDSQGHSGGIRSRLHTGWTFDNWLVLLITYWHASHRKHNYSIVAYMFIAPLHSNIHLYWFIINLPLSNGNVFTEPLPRKWSVSHNILRIFLIFHQWFFSKNSFEEWCLTPLPPAGASDVPKCQMLYECMRGRPSRPLHRDLQWSIVLNVRCHSWCWCCHEAVYFYAIIVHLTTPILTTELIILESLVNNEIRGRGRKWQWPNYRYYSSISLGSSGMSRGPLSG
jgi:hypothetical protein